MENCIEFLINFFYQSKIILKNFYQNLWHFNFAIPTIFWSFSTISLDARARYALQATCEYKRRHELYLGASALSLAARYKEKKTKSMEAPDEHPRGGKKERLRQASDASRELLKFE